MGSSRSKMAGVLVDVEVEGACASVGVREVEGQFKGEVCFTEKYGPYCTFSCLD